MALKLKRLAFSMAAFCLGFVLAFASTGQAMEARRDSETTWDCLNGSEATHRFISTLYQVLYESGGIEMQAISKLDNNDGIFLDNLKHVTSIMIQHDEMGIGGANVTTWKPPQKLIDALSELMSICRLNHLENDMINPYITQDNTMNGPSHFTMFSFIHMLWRLVDLVNPSIIKNIQEQSTNNIIEKIEEEDTNIPQEDTKIEEEDTNINTDHTINVNNMNMPEERSETQESNCFITKGEKVPFYLQEILKGVLESKGYIAQESSIPIEKTSPYFKYDQGKVITGDGISPEFKNFIAVLWDAAQRLTPKATLLTDKLKQDAVEKLAVDCGLASNDKNVKTYANYNIRGGKNTLNGNYRGSELAFVESLYRLSKYVIFVNLGKAHNPTSCFITQGGATPPYLERILVAVELAGTFSDKASHKASKAPFPYFNNQGNTMIKVSHDFTNYIAVLWDAAQDLKPNAGTLINFTVRKQAAEQLAKDCKIPDNKFTIYIINYNAPGDSILGTSDPILGIPFARGTIPAFIYSLTKLSEIKVKLDNYNWFLFT